MKIVFFPGPSDDGAPGRRLAIPLRVSVSRGLRFVKARLLSMEIPARVGENIPVHSTGGTEEEDRRLVKINPNRGSWGLRLLELELSNPTDEAFEISVMVQPENSAAASKTRIDRDYSARVLIPLEHFKLPVIDGSFFSSEKSAKAEVESCIDHIVSKIKVKWQSGRSSLGELSIKEAAQTALQSTVMDVLLPDPLTFVFRLRPETGAAAICSGDMVPLEILVRNNTKETIHMDLAISCLDVSGNNCVDGDDPTVLWAGIILSLFLLAVLSLTDVCMFSCRTPVTGVMSVIRVEVPALGEVAHAFSLYFMVPGEYTLLGSAVIEQATDMLRTRAKAESPDGPIFCRGSPFHLHVTAAA